MPETSAQPSSRPLKIPDADACGATAVPTRDRFRIALFVPSFPELSETFILRQVVGLLERGHDVRVFAHRAHSGGPMHAAAAQLDLARLVRVIGEPRPESDNAWATARAASAALRCLRGPYARSFGGWRPLARTIATLARDRDVDVVHCHYGNVGLRYAVAACVWDAPLVVSFYGYDSSQYPRERGAHVYEPLFDVTNAVTSLSRHMDARLVALGCPPERIRRVPLAVDPTLDASLSRASGRDDGVLRLLTVARLTEKKGIAYALQAVALLARAGVDARYDVIGDGPLRASLEMQTSELDLRDRVRFLGARTEEEVQRALREADVFVLPSVTAESGDEEGTPTVLLEAAYAGLPVVATRHAGIPEIVADGESGVLVAERNVEALAAALRGLLANRERWPAMARAGRRLVEGSHTTPVVAERLERLYRDLVSARRAGTQSPSRADVQP